MYREFLSTCDGLPRDVVFPRLLGADELARGPDGTVLISECSPQGFLVLTSTGTAVECDPAIGRTVHRSFRALLEHHLRLLKQVTT